MHNFSNTDGLNFSERFRRINWGLVFLIAFVCSIGLAMLYSAGGQSWSPWAKSQGIRALAGIAGMLILAMLDIRFWLKFAYPFYFITLLLLIVVEIFGHIGMGAQRWINLGFIVIQPSEIMKISLILALARYFHVLPSEDIGRIHSLIIPVCLTLAPIALVLMQPNLGTALLLGLVATAIFFVSGVRKWKFFTVAAIAAAIAPIAWGYLHDYQKQRVLTFLNPDDDKLGSGYNIIQSKIALGAGGVFGKGFGLGTQSQLQFLPEKHTDFIFVVLAEELGMVGALFLFALFFMIIIYGYLIALSSRSQFARIAAFGLITNFFLYICVNICMVTGMIPVVGIPLPLVSYGGTQLLTLLGGFGILLSLGVQRDIRISRTLIIDG